MLCRFDSYSFEVTIVLFYGLLFVVLSLWVLISSIISSIFIEGGSCSFVLVNISFRFKGLDIATVICLNGKCS